MQGAIPGQVLLLRALRKQAEQGTRARQSEAPLHDSCLHPDFPWSWSVIGTCKPDELFGHGLYHSKKREINLVTLFEVPTTVRVKGSKNRGRLPKTEGRGRWEIM